jgi:hypothetical protein
VNTTVLVGRGRCSAVGHDQIAVEAEPNSLVAAAASVADASAAAMANEDTTHAVVADAACTASVGSVAGGAFHALTLIAARTRAVRSLAMDQSTWLATVDAYFGSARSVSFGAGSAADQNTALLDWLADADMVH